MAFPYDDEEQKDPLVIEDHPHPTGDVIQQSQLQAAPETAPTPTTQVDAFARGAPAMPKQEAQPAPATIPQQSFAPPPEDAYTRRDIPEPVLAHHAAANPDVEQEVQLQQQDEARSIQHEQQQAEDQRVQRTLKSLKAQGVELETDPQTLQERPKVDDQGRMIFKPAVISPFENRDGTLVSVHRDRFGNEQDVPLKPKIDKDTGEKYVTSADGVSRLSLGVDQDYILRRDANNAGKLASQSRAELGLVSQQRTELKKQIEDIGGKAGLIASNKNPSDEDRAQLKQLQINRQKAVSQLDQLDQLHAQKSDETQSLTQDYLSKRKLITDKIRAGLPQPTATPEQPAPTPAPALNPAIADAKAGKKPYTIDDKGGVQFSREKPVDSLDAAVADGIVNKDYADKHRADFQKVQDKFDELKKAAGSASVLKAVLHGAGIGGAFLAGAGPGAAAGAGIGAAITAPLAEGGGLGPAIGSVIGGLATGTAAAFAARKGLQKLSEYSDAVKSLTSSAELHPVADAAGEFVAFGASAPRALTNMYRVGKLAYAEEGLRGAAKVVGTQAATQAVGGLAFEGVARPTFDAARYMVADQLGIPHDKFQGPSATSLGQMVGLSLLVGGNHIAFKDYSAADLASILLRGKVRAMAGLKPTEPMSVPEVVDTMQKMGVDIDAAGAQSMTQPLNQFEAALHTDLSKKVAKMQASGQFEDATGAQFKSATQAVIPTLVPGKGKVISSSVVEAERGGAGPATGGKGAPKPPTPPDLDVMPQLQEALSTHAEDLSRQRDMLQSEVDDTSLPTEGKSEKIAQIKEIDDQLSQLPTKPTGQNEQIQPAQRTNEPQPPAPGPSGQPANRSVPDEAQAQAEIQQPAKEGAEAQPRQRETPAAGSKADLQSGTDAGRLLNPPDLKNTEEAIAHGGSGEANVPALLKRRDELLKQALIQTGDEKVATITKAQLYREAATTAAATQNQKAREVDQAAHEAATSPTNERPAPSMAQHEANNAKLGHQVINGLDISFENPQGSIRTNVDMARVRQLASAQDMGGSTRLASQIVEAHERGDAQAVQGFSRILKAKHSDISKAQPWANKMQAHYGYIKRTEGKDGDQVDVFVKPGTPQNWNGRVIVVNQKNASGGFDEHKAMIGYDSMSEATASYAAHHDKPAAQLIHSSVGMSMDTFKKWAREGDLTKPATGTSTDYAVHKPEAAPVLQREPSKVGETGSERGRVEPGKQGDEVAGERGRVQEPSKAAAEARRLIGKALIGDKAKATLDHLGVSIKDTSEDSPKLQGKYAMRTGWLPESEDNPKWAIYIDYDRLAKRMAVMTPENAADYTSKGVEEEMLHVAQLEAVKRAWLETKDKTGWDFQMALEAEYQQVEEVMTDEEKAAVKEAYGEHAGKWQGSTLGAEFVRQLVQQNRTGKITEAVIRAKPIIERILAVLRKLLDNAKAWSEALKRAFDSTQAVLDEIDAARKPKIVGEKAPPGGWKKFDKVLPKDMTEYLGENYVGQDVFRDKAGVRHVRDGGALISQDVEITPRGMVVESPEQLAQASKHRFLTREEMSKYAPAGYETYTGKGGVTKLRKKETPQVPALAGMTPLGGKPPAPAPPSDIAINSGASAELKAQAKEAFKGLFASEPKSQLTPIGGPAGSMEELTARHAATKLIEQGRAVYSVLPDGETPIRLKSAADIEKYDPSELYVSTVPLREDEHGINFYAPEPVQQASIPKDRRAAFMDLADKMETEGVTTPEKVAAFVNEISDGRGLQYTRALWKIMESTGAVDEANTPASWDNVISLARTGAKPNVESSNEPTLGQRGSDAGLTGAGEGENAGKVEATGEVPPGSVSATGKRSGAGQSAISGPGGDKGGKLGQGGEDLAATRSDDEERIDSPVAGAGSGDSGDTSLTGPTERVGTGERAPDERRNFRIGPDTVLAPSGRVAKVKANLAALKLLKQLQQDNIPATPEQQAKLAQFTGWGHTKEVFNEGKAKLRGQWNEDTNWTKSYGAAYDQLKKLLTPDEWERAAESTLNAHYTAPQAIRAIWGIVRRLGFKGGRVLEPALGVGHFFGLMPSDLMQHSKLFGLDMDSIGGGIAQKLYPNADIKIGRFEKAKYPNNYFDVTVGNFPFHEVGPVDSRYPQLNLHNYFFARDFDLTKPGGLIVAITSNSTLDNNPDQRKYLQDKADLVTAIRLPNTAFQENAGTEVTTDILVFRKPDGTPFKGEPFLNTGQVGEDAGRPIVANEYFARHPEMALGKHSLQGTMYRKDSYALTPDKYRPLAESLHEAIEKVPANVFTHARDFYEDEQRDFGMVSEGEKEGSVSFREGQPIQVTGNEYKRPAWADAGFRSRTRDPQKRIDMAKSFVALRDQMKKLLGEELNPASTDENLSETRSKLRELYNKHVGQFGQLEKGNLKFLEDDPEYYLVMGLEITGRERKGDTFEKTIKPADILTQRTLFPVSPPTHVPEIKDAAMVSMQYRGKIDVPYVAELTGQHADDVEHAIIESGIAFKNPATGLLETRDAYLSSNVRQKLREAEAAAVDDPRYQKNVEELKAIQPERVGFENIRARAGSSWIPEQTYTAFSKSVLGQTAKVTYNKTLDRWSVSLGDKDTRNAENRSLYGTDRATGVDILTDVLNLRNPKIYDTVEEINEAGKVSKKQVLNKAATDQAQAKALRFKQEFDSYIRQDPDANKLIEDTYNDKFNSYVVPTFDGSHLVFPGMASVYKGKPLKLRSNQKDGIYRVTQTGGVLLAHGVGAGKTITQIASAMEMRRLGHARKPLIVVDKPTTGQFAQTFRQVYPNANVLVATEDSFTAPNRKRFMSRIATGNWDAVVMSNSQFDLMPSDPEVIQQYVQTQIDQLKEVADEVANDEGKASPKVRQIRTEIKRLENRLGKLLERLGARQDDTIYFEQSGVDALFIDEVHGYKKVPFITKMDPVKGIDRQPSQKAIALHAKVQFVHENNRSRNVITATGTPVTNTLAEAWNMTRLVNPKLLDEWGVDTFDKFVSTFAEVVNSTEINAANQWVSVERLSRFINGPELVKMIRTAWDVRMGEDLKDLNLPAIKGGKPELVSLEVSPEQLQITEFLQSVYAQFQAMQPKKRREYSWIPIVTMSTGMAASVDPRLVNPSLPDNPNSVVNKAVENIAAIYHETAAKRSTQIVFLDRYRPMNTEKIRRFAAGATVSIQSDEQADEAMKDQANRQVMESGDSVFSDAPLNLYNDIREKLVKAGVQREEIAIAHEHDSDVKRLKMQEDMQTGRIRILLGSTAKIGQGINVSDKLYAAHHLDPPIQMTPAQYIQRNGRIIRDPNENEEVRMLNYGMKRTLAAGIWDRINTKAKFIIQVLMGRGVGRDFEDPADEVTMSIAEQVAELTGDRRVLRKVELESEVRALQAAREAHFNNVGGARRKLRETQEQISRFTKDLIPAAEKDKTFLEQAFGLEGKNFIVKVGERNFTDPKEYDATIDDLVETGQKKATQHFEVKDNERDWSIHYNATQLINGIHAETELLYFNPKRSLSGTGGNDIQTIFSTPNTKGLGSTRATTGTGMFQAAKKLWENRDTRIQQLQDASKNERDQIAKLEAEAGKTFGQEEELNTKAAELDKLTKELLGTDKPAAEAEGGSLTEGLAAPEPTQPDELRGVLVSAFSELPAVEKKVLSMKLAGKDDAEIAKAVKLTPVGVATAYQIALRKMQKAKEAAVDIKGTMRKVVAEKSGQRTMGRPGLANPAAGDLSRKLVDTIDEIRKNSGIPTKRSDTDVIKEARQRLTKNYAAERKALIEKAVAGIQLDDTETVMAKKIVAREALAAVRVGTDEKVLEAAKLIDAYRMTGTQQARAFRQRFDNYLSPEERASEYIAESLLTPDVGRRDRLNRLGEQITDLEQELEAAKNRNADPMELKKLLDERESKLEERERIIKNWTTKIAGIKKKLAKLGIDLDNMSEDEIAGVLKDTAKAKKAVRAVAMAKADKWDALYEYWINGLLSSPTTVAVKMASDVAHALLDFGPQRWIEAIVNEVLPGEKSTSANLGELPYVYKAIFPALGRAFTNFLQSLRSECPTFEGEFTGSDFIRHPAIEGVHGQIIRTPTRLIMAADDAASSALATMQVQAEAYRTAAIVEGLTGDALAHRMIELTELNSGEPNDAWVAARSYSAMIRFQTPLGQLGKWLQRGKKSVPGVRYVIPFLTTMSNIFKTAIKKTPLGSVRILWKLAREGMVKMDWDGSDYHYERSEFVRNAAEQILAMAVMFGLLSLTRKRDDGMPIMTGSTPYTPGSKGQRDLAMRTAPPTSIKIGDRWYNYSRIEPYGVALVTMVDMLNDARELKGGGDVGAEMGKLLNQSISQIKDKTFARGVGDVLNAIQDGEHATEWAGNFATTWVPFSSLVKAGARNSDDTIRETRVWGREEWTQSLIDSLKYRAMPVASDVIQPKIDLWGREIKRDQGISPATDWLYRMTVPVATIKTDKALDVDRAILNWNNTHPEEIFAPAPPPPIWQKKIDGKEQHIYMNRDEYRRFLEISGSSALGRVEVLGIDPEHPTKKNIEDISRALEKARKDARERVWELRISRASSG